LFYHFARHNHRRANDSEEIENVINEVERDLATKLAINVFDLSRNLTEKSLAMGEKKYEVLSPISISSALQLALLGSKGKTYQELISL
jgi:hypothetical protein